MSLAIDYCKEIARELKKTAVYIPGASVNVGDILHFNEPNIFGVPRALGAFEIKGNLSNLGVNRNVVKEPINSLDSYVYASKGSVSVSFEAAGQAGTVGNGKLTIGFSKAGSTYLSAVDCRESRFESIIGLETDLNPHQSALDWSSHFIVISVTVAAKALIMQSNSSTASLEIDGSVKNLAQLGTTAQSVDAALNLKIAKYKEANFIKDWSDNVPVFFTLVRFKRKFAEAYFDLATKKMSSFEAKLSPDLNTHNPYVIEVIDPADLI